MALKNQGTALQSGVDFMVSGKEGTMNKQKPSSVRTYAYGTSMSDGDVIPYGGACILDTDLGVRPVASGDVVANLMGFAVYENRGIVEDNGYKKGGLMPNIAVCEFGEIVLPVKAGETLAIGDTVYLYYTAGSDFGKLSSSSTNAIDISAKVRVSGTTQNGLVSCTLVKFAN